MAKIKPAFIAAGVSLAMAFTFSCSSDKDDDGTVSGGSNCSANFRTVRIGTQTWMAENLNCNVEGSLCYGNDPANCVTYGRLYDWQTALTVCPSGWHLPSNAEWDKLYRYADGTSGTESPYSSLTAGTKLKSQTGWNSYSGVPAGTDEFGFSALPGGGGNSVGSFYDVGDYGYWWSASEYEGNSYNACDRGMYYGDEYADWNGSSKTRLFSVRCLQD